MSELDGEHRTVVIVGGGQAGLSVSYFLTRAGVDHVVLERERPGHEWRTRRWDSFCLVTPNWQCLLPGFPYAGADRHGFMLRDEVAAYVEDFARSFDCPLVTGVEVTRLRERDAGGFALSTTGGTLTADHVVVATGPYQVPSIPRLAERFPSSLTQLHSSDYRNPQQLPAGEVLVVGSGQSGCQIAEDLHLAGRTVHLSVGSAPRVARRYRGRDVVDWLADMGYYERGIDEFSDVDAVRFRANHYVTGRDGGHDIDLRAFAADGMRLYGRLATVDGHTLGFADDLTANLDGADAVSEGIKDSIDAYLSARGIDAPEESRYVPVWEPDSVPTELDLAGTCVTSVVWSTGFAADYRWIEVPVFDGRGYPTHERGVTSRPGLYFIGLPWQHSWGSGRFEGVARDAEYLSGHLMARIEAPPRPRMEVPWIAGLSAEATAGCGVRSGR